MRRGSGSGGAIESGIDAGQPYGNMAVLCHNLRRRTSAFWLMPWLDMGSLFSRAHEQSSDL